MEQEQKEAITYRIISGEFRFRYGDMRLKVIEPDSSLMYEASEIYKEAFEDAYLQGLYTEQERLDLLLKNNLWSPLDDKHAESLSKEIDDLKVECFKNFWNKRELRGFKNSLRRKEKEWQEALMKKHQFSDVSISGYASAAKWTYIISNSTYHMNDEKCLFENVTLPKVVQTYQSNKIKDSEIRECARSTPWSGMWGAANREGSLFGKPTATLTREQLLICQYSRMYDGIYENPDAPDDKIIEDDDALDGWMISERKKRKEEKAKSEAEQMIGNSKISGAGEVFVMADSIEEREKIMSLNSAESKNIIAERNARLEQEGSLVDAQLPDVQRDLLVQQNEAFISNMGGNKT
jgi:hypothetical protein